MGWNAVLFVATVSHDVFASPVVRHLVEDLLGQSNGAIGYDEDVEVLGVLRHHAGRPHANGTTGRDVEEMMCSESNCSVQFIF